MDGLTAVLSGLVIARLFSSDRSLDCSGVYRKGELLPNQLCQLACPHRLARNKLLLDELQRLALQLMGSVWTALSGYQSGEAALVEDGLGLVVGRPRYAVFFGGFGHGGLLHRHPAEHLILDLHEVARVEEIVFLKLRIAHLLRAWVQSALFEEGLDLGGFRFAFRGCYLPFSVNVIMPHNKMTCNRYSLQKIANLRY